MAVAPLLAAGAALLSAFTILRGYGPHDEGLMLAWAGRIADGQWPYRDFWCNYAPGQPLVLAGLVKALGPSLLWWRVLRVALDALVAVLAYRLVRREAGPGWALGAWLAVAGAMAFPTGPGPNPPALALALAALLAVRRTPAGAGALAGLAIAVRPEIGLAVAAAVVVTSRSWRPAAIAGAVAGVVLAPFVLVAGGAMADQVLGFAAIQGQQRLPFPLEPDVGWDLNRLFEHFFPALLVVGAVGWALWALVRRPAAARWAPGGLVVVGLAYLLARTDEFHLVPLSVALAVVLALAGATEARRGVRVALGVGLAVIALHGVDRRAGQLLHPPALAALPGEVADGVRAQPRDARALAQVIDVVRDRTPAGEPVLVAPPRFDRVRVGHPLLSVLLARPNPTRYDVMAPGVVTTAAVQREMARDLRATPTPVVVRWLAPVALAREPNRSGRSSGVSILDAEIAARYRLLARFGDYAVLVLTPRRR